MFPFTYVAFALIGSIVVAQQCKFAHPYANFGICDSSYEPNSLNYFGNEFEHRFLGCTFIGSLESYKLVFESIELNIERRGDNEKWHPI